MAETALLLLLAAAATPFSFILNHQPLPPPPPPPLPARRLLSLPPQRATQEEGGEWKRLFRYPLHAPGSSDFIFAKCAMNLFLPSSPLYLLLLRARLFNKRGPSLKNLSSVLHRPPPPPPGGFFTLDFPPSLYTSFAASISESPAYPLLYKPALLLLQ